jgi:hypothetical protein
VVERHNGVWGGCWWTDELPRTKHRRAVDVESQGFERTRRRGKHHWVVGKVVR